MGFDNKLRNGRKDRRKDMPVVNNELKIHVLCCFYYMHCIPIVLLIK